MKPYLNRELSWLQFNQRVLKQALDANTPLLEKSLFVSIYGSNLDEFFMVRIGSLSDQVLINPDYIDVKTGQNSQQQIQAVMDWLRHSDHEVTKVVQKVQRDFEKAGFRFLDFNNLTKIDQAMTKRIYQNEIKPILSAQIIDPHHPFPFLDNNESYIILRLKSKNNPQIFAIVPLGKIDLIKTFSINGIHSIFFSSDLILHNIHNLFKKYEVLESVVIRITRNADIDLNGEIMDEHEDFLDVVESLLKKRRRLQIVRLQLSHEVSNELMDYLKTELKISDLQIIVNHYPLNLKFGSKLRSIFKDSYPNLVYEPKVPVLTLDFAKYSGLAYVKQRDVLLAYPYQSSQPFIQLLYEAGNNPNVVSIKISLYRLSSPSRIAAALSYAAEKGKEVIAVMELRARFDEQSNIDYTKILENSGVRVIFGHSQYKVHSKLCLITMREKNAISYITYVGTGNFNEATQEMYTDLAIITSNYQVGQDANDIFDMLAMNDVVDETQVLWAAPRHYRQEVIAEIDKEIQYALSGQPTSICLKLNSMNDILIIDKLIEASQAKVKVFLIIRGICCLIPQMIPESENIMVKSIVGRHLEHSRIFRFGEKERARLYIGSGDFLNRNTQRRIEVFIKLTDANIIEQVNHILEVEKSEDSYGWLMQADQEYVLNCGKYHSQDVLRDYFAQFVVAKEEMPVAKETWFKKMMKHFFG